MKKRILSIVLTLCMVMAIMPQTAVAADADWENKIWIGDTPVNSSTNLKDNTWMFFPGYNILVLSGGFSRFSASNLTGSKDKAVIRIESLKNVTIQLLGNATVGVPSIEWTPPEAADGVQTYGIYAPDTNLAIEGAGTLKISSNANAIWCKNLRVEGSTLNCNSYRTAIKVVGTGYIDKEENGDMLVKSGATVTAKTLNGSGVYPEEFDLNGGQYKSIGFNYNENGGAAVLVSGDLTVEDSTVTGENTCNKLPSFIPGYNVSYLGPFYRSRFCSAIFSWGPMKVSGAQASVSGKLKINETDFGNEDYGGCTELGAVMAARMMVEDGGTIEGFITNSGNSNYAQGLKSFNQGSHPVQRVNICLTGEGVFRNGLADKTVTAESPNYIVNGPYNVYEDTNPRDLYPSYRQITISKSTAINLRKTAYGQEWSFQDNFLNVYSMDSTTIDLRDFAASAFVENGWNPEDGFPEIYVHSGDWTLLPSTDMDIGCSIEKGSLTVQYEKGQTYPGGCANIEAGATLNIQGDGISEDWEIGPMSDVGVVSGSVRFINGTVNHATASARNQVYILGGNIGFVPFYSGQIVRNGDGKQLFRDIYYMNYKNLCQCQDELVAFDTGEGIVTPENSYYYPIGDYRALITWTVNDLEINYVTVATEDGETYNLINGGAIATLGNEYHILKRAERYKEFVPNPNNKFFKNPDESVTLHAAGSIKTYEIRLDSAFYGPYLIDSTTDLGSDFRAEWSYQNENDEKVIVGGNSLTYTVSDLSDIVDYRTYTCTVYEKAADGSEKAIGSYNAKIYVMRWEQPDNTYGAVGKEVTFTANPSEEAQWTVDFLRTLKWQVNKGTGWEDIPDSKADSYTVTVTEENAGYKYRRVLWGSTIGNFETHEASIYMEFASPELSVTFAPEITSQPQSIKIQENDTTKHELCVGASNAESYRWQKKVDGAFIDIEGAASSTLEIGVEDTGTYRCVVKNAYGETVSEEASVETSKAPSCGHLNEGKAALGEKIVLGVEISDALGDRVSVKWQYSEDNGVTWVDVVSVDDRDNISMNVLIIVFSQVGPEGVISRREELRSSSMTIQKTTADMDGWKVRCVLTDAVGVYYSNTVELSIDMPDYTVTFDTDGGTEIASKTPVKWKDKVLDGITAPTRSGYTFNGWKCVDTPVTADTTYAELAADGTVTSITLTAQWAINQYTITFDTNGGSEIEPITQNYGTAITAPADPTREGYTFTGWDKAIPDTMPAENMIITAQWKDSEKPTGEISVGENSWKAFLNKITFGLFFKDTQTVTITAADNSGGAVTVEYLLSERALTETELDGMTFTAYTSPFRIDPDNEYIVYVKLTDTTGNTTYICSDGIVLDGTSPVITGIENGKTYCEAQTVTINERYVDTVTVNAAAVTLDETGSFVLAPADGEQTIVVTDKAGNTAEMTVTVNDGHTGGTATCEDKAKCEICGEAYGEIDPKNHADLTHISAKPASKDAEGNIEYWHCDGCDKYYSDENGKIEIKLDDTVIAKLPPEIIEGKEQSVTEGEKKDLTFRPDAAFSDFIRVELDGKTLDEKNYTVKEGGTIVTLKADYVATLSAGEHTIGIVSESGTATATFTVNAKAVIDNDTKSPQTEDNSHMALWMALFLVSGGAITALTVKRKKLYQHGGNEI